MKRHKAIIIFALAIFAVLMLKTVFFIVDQNKDIYVITTFGKITDTVDGRTDPGLHFKLPWPIQKEVRLESRKQTVQTAQIQFPIANKINIICSTYCSWKITDPEKFYRLRKTPEVVNDELRALLSNYMKDIMSEYKISDMVNTDPEKIKLTEIEHQILNDAHQSTDAKLKNKIKTFAQAASDSFGIEIIDVGIDSLGFPQSITDTIIQAMINEREREIKRYQSEGTAIASTIIARGESAQKKILAIARAKGSAKEAEGYSERMKTLVAQKENQELATFLAFIESLKIQLKGNTQFILDRKWIRDMSKGFYDAPTMPRTVDQK